MVDGKDNHCKLLAFLTLLRRSGTSNDLYQFTSNDSLAGSVEQNLEFVDHFSSVLRSILYICSFQYLQCFYTLETTYVHGIATCRLFASVTFGKSLNLR